MGYVTPASQSAISFTDVYQSANNAAPSANSNISASVLMKQSWPKGPYGDSTYPYTGWGSSGSYNYANRLCGVRQQNTTQSLGKFYDLLGTCEGHDLNVFPNYTVQYDIDVLFGGSDTITDVTFKIIDSTNTATLVSDYQADLGGPGPNIIGPILLSTDQTPNVQNCYWTLDFYCDYRSVTNGSMRGFCNANDGTGEQVQFTINPITDGNTYNLNSALLSVTPTASLTGSTGGGFKWRFEFN
jgi:hypothetical protein